MKKKLFLLVLATMFTATLVSAQKTWNFADSVWGTPTTSPYASNTVVDNLGIGVGPATTFGIIDQSFSNGVLVTKTFADGSMYTNRFKYGGNSFASGATGPYIMPTQRYLYFAVTGACTITVYYASSSSGATSTATLNITDGTNILSSTVSGASQAPTIATATYTGGAGTIYLVCAPTQGLNIYAIKSSANVGTTLGVSDLATAKANNTIFTSGNQLYISKVNSDTKVSVFAPNGTLVKSFSTKSDTNVQLKSGLYIVNTQSDKGSQSQKVIVK